MENCYYGNICHPEQRYRRIDIWSTLLQWRKAWETTVLILFAILSKSMRIKWYLVKFVTLSKTVVNDYFEHICHTEKRYGRSDNLTSFTTLGETQIRWIFAPIYYPGQHCWKMSFGHFYYIEQKSGKLQHWPNLL